MGGLLSPSIGQQIRNSQGLNGFGGVNNVVPSAFSGLRGIGSGTNQPRSKYK